MILKPIGLLAGGVEVLDTGWLTPTRGISNNKVVEGNGWGGPENIATASETDFVTQTLYSWGQSRALSAAGFSSALAAIDENASIVGIEAKVKCKVASGADDSSSWNKRGVASGMTTATAGTKLGAVDISPVVNIKVALTEFDFGSPTDLWGCASLTIGQFKNDDYCGVGVAAKQNVVGNDTYVYTFKVKFYYTA